MSTWYILVALVLLFVSQRQMTNSFSRLIHHLGGSQKTLVILWSIIFLPGTVIHEISHFLLAAATGTRTGKIEIFPEFLEKELDDENDNHGVRLGSVQVAHMNPLQGFLVGTAPFFTGLLLLGWLSSLITNSFYSQDYLFLLLYGYLFFVIANSFFPSWADIKHTLPFIFIALTVSVLVWLLGFQFTLDTASPIWALLNTLNTALSLSIIFNLVIIIVLFICNRILHRQ